MCEGLDPGRTRSSLRARARARDRSFPGPWRVTSRSQLNRTALVVPAGCCASTTTMIAGELSIWDAAWSERGGVLGILAVRFGAERVGPPGWRGRDVMVKTHDSATRDSGITRDSAQNRYSGAIPAEAAADSRPDNGAGGKLF